MRRLFVLPLFPLLLALFAALSWTACIGELPSLEGFPCKNNSYCGPNLQCIQNVCRSLKSPPKPDASEPQPDASEPPPELRQEKRAEDILGPEEGICVPGSSQPCYSGPRNTRGVGICRPGRRKCKSDGTWGDCQEEVLPQKESCGPGNKGDKKDNDCNGYTDEGCCNWTAGAILKKHEAGVVQMAFHHDGSLLVSASQNRSIRLWEIPKGKHLRHFDLSVAKGHSGNVTSLALHPQKELFLTGSQDKTMKLWSLEKGHLLETFLGHSQRITAVAFSPNGSEMASASEDGALYIWQSARDKPLFNLSQHTGPIRQIAYAPSGFALASASDDKTGRLWDRGDGRSHGYQIQHPIGVTAVAFSPDSKQVITGDQSGIVKLSGYLADKYSFDLKQSSAVVDLAVTPDGKILVVALQGSIKFWNLLQRKEYCALSKETKEVTSIAVSPDGKTLAYSLKDKTIHLWHHP